MDDNSVPPPPPPMPRSPGAHASRSSTHNKNNNDDDASLPPPPPPSQPKMSPVRPTAQVSMPVQLSGDTDNHRNSHHNNHHSNNNDDDGEEADGNGGSGRQQTHTRRALHAIRRRGSFNRLSTLSDQLEEWFFTDATVHQQWADFVNNNVPAEGVINGGGNDPTGTSNSSSGLTSATHQSQELHGAFCELFEEQLEAALEARNVTLEQFAERIRLDKEEEERDGSHFYRWLEVIEFPSFVLLVSPPEKLLQSPEHNGNRGTAGVAHMLAGLRKLSEDARRKFRKSSILGPVLAAWSPRTFAAFDRVVTAALKQAGIDTVTLGGMNRADAKQMVRWRQRLNTPVLNEHGVFGPPPVVVDEELLQYLSSMTVAMHDEAFDRFTQALRQLVKEATAEDESRLQLFKEQCTTVASVKQLTTAASKPDATATKATATATTAATSLEDLEDLLISLEQRQLLELFFELDVRHQGKIPLVSALRLMVQCGTVAERELQRALVRHKHYRTKQPGEVFLERQQSELAELKRRRSSIGSDGSSGGASAGNVFGASTASEKDLFGEDENEDESSATDPPVPFKLFYSVVREPLRATLRGRTVQKLCPNEDSPLAPLFQWHDAFMARVETVRKRWLAKH